MSSDVIYFAHALDTSPMRARVLTQKSEEATASSASLLATPLILCIIFLFCAMGRVGRHE